MSGLIVSVAGVKLAVVPRGKMSSGPDWHLCSRRDCEARGLLPREDQVRIVSRITSGQYDAIRMQSIRSLLARHKLRTDPRRLSDKGVLDEVSYLLRNGWLHIHLHQKAYHRPGSYDVVQKSAASKAAKGPTRATAPIDWDTWVAVKLVDDDGMAVAGARFRITLPDRSVQEGTLNAEGEARVESTRAGQCEISFPDIDARAWNPA
jgi:hypothetical protein